ncbi:MAG TPA: 16S rRNA (guanine(527)-N(7))-methyltransferase RsmG [Bacillota bacterium]|jgi:16S rRNA (guanine527-N7)-methyltransferase|nr:16S rRNA (guanine(527)-N(7))-methyltransferase RsmG [Bacillota bacterium]HOA34644.1 16S rRNA (guanine(527)-N(7))-methyltransferase RsmG [Bacillota bacterium]HOJ83274.1 16S rRNA (guanine(527)-N(7))-methyltransferase RsmG [Bacillota bacterium]HPZ11353.1 16S rRNA (guanine(527)-N(7))-methyltransferase RsmG [Bacillota bacterium]HQE09375.1 16S rRNA (guanine(527)-N(7))-methyltransferase RsmG [Bacillota bacterium]
MTATRGFDELLTKVIAALGLIISGNQKEKLLNYIQLILEGLKKQRLVGERSGAALIEKHLYDSLYPLTTWQIPRGSLLDLGTGVGLPGIPMKICLPEQALYLLDANKKKINFLRKVALELALQEVFFLPGRAEEWGRDPGCREQFDCVVSRAVARAAVLVELGLPLVKMGGFLLLYKGKQGPSEIKEAGPALQLCGGRLEKSWHYRIPTGEERTLFLIKKIGPTPAAYPRRSGVPQRKPLGS